MSLDSLLKITRQIHNFKPPCPEVVHLHARCLGQTRNSCCLHDLPNIHFCWEQESRLGYAQVPICEELQNIVRMWATQVGVANHGTGAVSKSNSKKLLPGWILMRAVATGLQAGLVYLIRVSPSPLMPQIPRKAQFLFIFGRGGWIKVLQICIMSFNSPLKSS